MQIDDETLMALADGELDPARADELRRLVARDPALQARLHRFEETRRLLAGLRLAPEGEDPLAAMIRGAVTPEAPALPPPANLNRPPWVALAASLAVAVLGLGWWQWSGRAPDGFAPAELAALDGLPSGEVRRLESGEELAMIASFRDGDGALCREYETSGGDLVRVVLACRDDGAWQQRFAAVTKADGGEYRPASGEGSIDEALAAIGAQGPLSLEEEEAVLRK
ncbi:anti-sigma factor family protein [Paracoccus marinaquae]|uniref:Anti-sigma factor n=1 Tax=Paracoccus marinaquae TaxID=2841926 RepID=A0ABS6AH92_9RHOB|nr:hypothetical protein [Paracoccus marinaquae]MBU3029050.1 hypothetical protein [Paracoccus marinaquae]